MNAVQEMSGPRAWSILVKDELEKTRRRFESVDWRNELLLCGQKERPANGLLRVWPRNMPCEYQQVVSPPVPSSLPIHSAPAEDAALIRHCVEKTLLHFLSKTAGLMFLTQNEAHAHLGCRLVRCLVVL